MDTEPTSVEEIERWIDRFKRHFREIVLNTLVAGIGVFLFSNALLYIGIQYFPDLFINYISPVFNSDGSRDFYFYAHPFVLTHSLALLWNRFQKYIHGNFVKIGAIFAIVYSVVALVPILWITYAAMEVEFVMVFSWLIYGFMQSGLVGTIFGFLRDKKWV